MSDDRAQHCKDVDDSASIVNKLMSVPNIPLEDLKTIVVNSLTSVFQTMLNFDCECRKHEDLTGLKIQMPEWGGANR